jgi:hypothetical protein
MVTEWNQVKTGWFGSKCPMYKGIQGFNANISVLAKS